MHKPVLVSIIMPCYNSVDYITDAVQSIMAQTFTDWELLIVDDCSTDKRIFPLLEKIVAMDARIKVLHTEVNAGAGVARNVAIKEAKGRYIAFCDSDDWWCPDKLERQMKWMKNNDYHFICSYYETCDECLNPFHVVRLPRKIGFKRLCCGYAVGPSGVVYDTKHIGKVFMPQLRRGGHGHLAESLTANAVFVHVSRSRVEIPCQFQLSQFVQVENGSGHHHDVPS